MESIKQLKSSGHIKPLPVQGFHVSEIDKAFMTFAKGSHIGKIVISYDDEFENGLSVSWFPKSISNTYMMIPGSSRSVYRGI